MTRSDVGRGRAADLNNSKTVDSGADSDLEETLNVYNYTYDGPQPYNYEPRERLGDKLMAGGER